MSCYIYIYIHICNIYIYIYIYVYIYVIMKKISPPGYHDDNGFLATHLDTWGHIVFMITYILHPPWFCEIWALCMSWITGDHSYNGACVNFS